MDLNKIQLSSSDIAHLYKNYLVEIKEEINKKETTDKQPALKYLGVNKKNVLIILSYENAVHIPDKQLAFLTKLLAACNLNLGDSAILNFYNYSDTASEKILSFFKPKVVFLFGVSPADFGLPLLFPHFQVQAHKNVSYLYSPPLDEIEPDKNLKTKLWASLKKIFNL